MLRVIGVGAGGHARVVLEILQASGNCEIVGLLDSNRAAHGTMINGIPVLGGDNLLPELRARGITHIFIGIGSIGDTRLRRQLFETTRQHGFQTLSAVHSQAIISPSAVIGEGAVVMAGAVVNANATIGCNVIINTHAVVEHDCVLEDHVHIATGALLAGGVTIGTGAHIGLGAAVKQGVSIGQNAIVGAGAVVLHDVPENSTVAGVPARCLK